MGWKTKLVGLKASYAPDFSTGFTIFVLTIIFKGVGGGGGSQCGTPRALTTLSCREYFYTKQISTVSFLTVVFGAKVLKILQICTFSPPKCCMLFI